MDTYYVKNFDVNVGMFEKFPTFYSLINWLFFGQKKYNPFEELGFTSIDDMIYELVDDHGKPSEDKAMELCKRRFDIINTDEIENDEQLEAEDHKYAAMTGR